MPKSQTQELELRPMESEVAKYEPTLLDIIAAASREPNVNVEKMRDLFELKLRIDAQEAQTAFFSSMKQACEEMRPVVRDAENKHTGSKYALLETIDSQIRPIYTRHGFSLSFNSPATDTTGVTVSCTVFHERGHSKEYQLSGALDGAGSGGKANKTPIQALGSTVSYLRRYLECMVFNIVLRNEDTDGNKAGTQISEEQSDNIERFITELGMNADAVSKFLVLMEAKTVREIRADRFRQAMMLLDGKRRKGGA